MKIIILALLLLSSFAQAGTLKLTPKSCKEIISKISNDSFSNLEDFSISEAEYLKLVLEITKQKSTQFCQTSNLDVANLKDMYSINCVIPCQDEVKKLSDGLFGRRNSMEKACMKRCASSIDKMDYLELGAAVYAQSGKSAPDCSGVVNGDKTRTKVMELDKTATELNKTLSK